MIHLPFFGLKNFKAFEGEHHFHFRDITFFIGTNSSGKSSVIDGLKVLNNKENHAILEFDKLIHENTNEDGFELVFRLFHWRGKSGRIVSSNLLPDDINERIKNCVGLIDNLYLRFKIRKNKTYELTNRDEIFENLDLFPVILEELEQIDLLLNEKVKDELFRFSLDKVRGVRDLIRTITNYQKLFSELESIVESGKKQLDNFKITSDNDAENHAHLESQIEIKTYYQMDRIYEIFIKNIETYTFFSEQNRFSKNVIPFNGMRGNYTSLFRPHTSELLNKHFDIEGQIIVMNNEVFIQNQNKELKALDQFFGRGMIRLVKYLVLNMIHYLDDDRSDKDQRSEQESRLFIIEEPEANLHPALQSRLADYLVQVNRETGIQFIIETHSEYLIRRMQYLMAHSFYKESEDSIPRVKPENVNI
jgi:predicted ATP-dependent endonuclease of OLD family